MCWLFWVECWHEVTWEHLFVPLTVWVCRSAETLTGKLSICSVSFTYRMPPIKSLELFPILWLSFIAVYFCFIFIIIIYELILIIKSSNVAPMTHIWMPEIMFCWHDSDWHCWYTCLCWYVICVFDIYTVLHVWDCRLNPLVSCRGHFGSWKMYLECCGEQRTWFIVRFKWFKCKPIRIKIFWSLFKLFVEGEKTILRIYLASGRSVEQENPSD